jgi:signal transduction histidine kinase
MNQIKILIVDDRPDNLLSMCSILERENYAIVTAGSGRAALKILLREYDFSLILMDVQMPDMSGFDTAAVIYQRDKLKNIPIIFITAHNHEDEAIFKGYQVGAVDFIYKPVNPELLKIKVGLFAELYSKTQSLIEQEQNLLVANAALQKEVIERETSEMKIRELNSQLLANNSHLKMVNEELDRFAYIASHDLQEPIRKILIFSDMILQKKFREDDLQRYMLKITDATLRMQQLVRDLLQYSKQSVTVGDFIATDLNDIVLETLTELELKIQFSNAKIMIDPLPTLPIIPSLIRQVFLNLISNAIKFRKKEQSPEIHIYAQKELVTLQNVAGNGSEMFCKIFITDNGMGFDNKYLNDLFVIFKRLHSYQDIEGSGIGLTICKKIVEQHRGYITASSELGKGSTFIVCLPVKEACTDLLVAGIREGG